MYISNEINHANKTYYNPAAAKKTDSVKNGIITAEDILAKMMALGASSAKVNPNPNPLNVAFPAPNPPYNDSYVHVLITPSALQRMIDDPDFLNSKLEILRNNVMVVKTYGAHLGMLICDSIPTMRLSREDLIIPDGGEREETTKQPITHEKMNFSNSNVNLIEKFSRRFAEGRELLAVKNEMRFFEKVALAYDKNCVYN